MVSFEIFVKAMPPSLLESKVLPSFCFAFKIPDNRAASNIYIEGYVSEREISYRLGFKDRFFPSQQQVNSNLSFPILKRRSVEILICIVSTSPEWVESPFL